MQLAIDRGDGVQAKLFHELKQLPAVQAVNSRADVIKNLEFIVETQRIFIGFLIVFSGVIFFSSLLNSSLISLAERRREVATLRVLGYTEWQVGGVVSAREPGDQLAGHAGRTAAWVIRWPTPCRGCTTRKCSAFRSSRRPRSGMARC